MNIQEFNDELAANRFDAAIPIERPVGYALDVHQHPFDACAFITAGDITLVVDGVSTRYAAGDVFRLPAGTPHLESAGPNGVAYLSGRRAVTSA